MAALLAVLPHLFNRHLLLVDFVDHRSRVLHFWQRGLLHSAGIAIVKGRDIDHISLAQLASHLPARMLRPSPVEVAFTLGAFALDGLAVLVDRLQELILIRRLPAFVRTENPLHLLVAADFDNR